MEGLGWAAFGKADLVGIEGPVPSNWQTDRLADRDGGHASGRRSQEKFQKIHIEGSKDSKGVWEWTGSAPTLPPCLPGFASRHDPCRAGPLGTSSHDRAARVACEHGDGDSCVSRSSAPHLRQAGR